MKISQSSENSKRENKKMKYENESVEQKYSNI